MKTPFAIIGYVGENCSGKDTSAQFIEMELGHRYSIVNHRFSDVLAETLKIWHLPITRENLQKLSPAMRQAYGADVLANAVEKRVLASEAGIINLSGIRWKDADVPVFKRLPNNFLVYITAPVEIRFERAKLRSQKIGERTSYFGEGDSFEKFLEAEKAITEIEIPEIGKLADFKINNSGTLDDLRLQIRQFITEKLRIESILNIYPEL